MKLKLWQVDAFSERPFSGNPAAVVPLKEWLADTMMLAIANENNLSETAFFVPLENGIYALRWFTPTMEVPLCGHATLASAWVIFSELAPELAKAQFMTKSGTLTVRRGENGRHLMSFPAGATESFEPAPDFVGSLGAAMGVRQPSEHYLTPVGGGGKRGVLGVWSEGEVRAMRLSGQLEELLTRAGLGRLIATARGDGAPYDFVSRLFAPPMGIPEDPVTGAAHCILAPFWAKRLGKQELHAYQASSRGGDILCEHDGERVILSGACALYMRGEIEIPQSDTPHLHRPNNS